MAADIFMSYARDDRDRVRSLVSILEEQNWSVWWDRMTPVGMSYDTTIATALRSAKCVAVVWSESSVESDWVRDEAETGKQRGILVPIFIDEVEAPLGFGRIQSARLIGWQGNRYDPEIDNLLEAIDSILREKLEAPEARKPPFVVKITAPTHDGMSVGKEICVKGSADIPGGHHLWILVHRTKGFKTLWWPQAEGEIDPQTKQWEVNVSFGIAQDVGEDFEIAAITVEEQEHVKLQEYWENAMTSGKWLPIKMPPSTSPPQYRKVKKESHH
jgi:hypothetical protein